MSQDGEKVKRLVEFKARLERKAEGLKSELEELQSMLDTVNSVLLEKGFRRPEITREPIGTEAPPSAQPSAEVAPSPEHLPGSESTVSLIAADGEPLATLCLDESSLRVLPAPGKEFNVNMPPFMSFLVERVLMKMQERDNELARGGQLAPDLIFSYNIIREGDIVREIAIKNIDSDRLRELKSSIRWTLEKMHEKIRSQS